MNKNRTKILTSKIWPLIIKLTLPSIAGMLGIMIFNIVDTYFVGRLGTLELAAVSFTFPVVMIVNCVLLGFSHAIMALFSRAAGAHNKQAERRLATSALILGILLSVIISSIGWFTTEPLFRLLGAGPELMPLINRYIKIWFIGVTFIVFPMFGDGILRGLGDTKTPAIIMLSAAIINSILDPILIFGFGFIPAMGIAGAAISTVFSRMLTTVISLYIQVHREHLISFKGLSYSVILSEWKMLFYIGLPNVAVKAITPLGIAIFTSILARYGNEVIAGYGVAVKVESVVLAVSHALGITAAVFIGQNLGAGHAERVRSGTHWLYLYGILFGCISAVLLAFGGNFLGSLFNNNPLVIQTTAQYLLIVPVGYGLYSVSQIAASILNVFHKPLLAGGLYLIQIAVIAVPLAYYLSAFCAQKGLFMAISISYVAVGLIALWIIKSETNKILPDTAVRRQES